jgi:hypothetical protein
MILLTMKNYLYFSIEIVDLLKIIINYKLHGMNQINKKNNIHYI